VTAKSTSSATLSRLGMLTPSSNTALEPLTCAMAADMPGVSAHFSRFRVTQIGLSAAALGQFDNDRLVEAAELLADAKVDVIAWNGTAAAWLGFARDEELCAAITARTGIPACTCILAYRELFESWGLRKIGLVTPYSADVQDRIMTNWDTDRFSCSAERHLGEGRDNFSFAEVTEDEIARMVRDVAEAGCDAAAIVCTNLKGSAIAPVLERELGIPVLDSISVTLWKSLVLAGRDPSALAAWGGPFKDVRKN
jgi:maleate isomerase